ncbi:MAG: hypothetical protein H7329_10025 [Opitutaceae bacterium]|nr:hypothetical protein [Cytophagales bacterium]
MQKVDFINYNPVGASLVKTPINHFYSSAMDYAGMKGMVKVVVNLWRFQRNFRKSSLQTRTIGETNPFPFLLLLIAILF